MPIKTYSTTASSNNASPPNGFPEGMAPASLNDGMRQVMADVRAWYEAPTYIDLGHTPTFVNTTTFTLVGDRTSTYTVGTRLRASGTTPFTVFGTIATSTFSSPNTTITITWDSSAMNSTLNEVAIVNIPDDSIVSSKIRSLAASKITGTLPVANGGTGLTALETTVASASTVDLGAQSAPTVNITGTTTITSFGTVASGTFRNVIFTGILQLTHNATSLILPGGANITTAAGDKLEAISLGSGNWRVVAYERAAGALAQNRAYAEYATNADLTTLIPYDDTIPQVTEGTQILSATITPRTTTNRVRARVVIAGAQSGTGNVYMGVALFRNGAADAIAAKATHLVNNLQGSHEAVLEFEHVPASTSLQTYTVRVGLNSGTLRLNGTSTGRIYGGVQICTLILEEITA